MNFDRRHLRFPAILGRRERERARGVGAPEDDVKNTPTSASTDEGAVIDDEDNTPPGRRTSHR